MSDMFNGVTLSTENYDAILNAWSQLTLQSSVSFHAGNSQYTVCKQAAKDILTSAPNNWSITDGGSVADAINPTISCIANQTKNLTAGQSAYTVSGTEFDPTATDDNCGVASVENDFNNSATLAGASIPVGTKNIVWTVTDNTGNTATCNFDVTVIANTTAIETLKQNGISIYPNPTNGILNFEFSDNNVQKIKILNLSGKTIIEKTSNILPKETFNLQGLKSGVYIITIQTNKEIFKTKIMKN